MKKTLFMTILLFLAIGSYAQIRRITNFRVIFPNKTIKSLFNANKKIKSYLIRCDENRPATISIYYFEENEQVRQEDEFYDLLFDGDLYRLKRRYGEIDCLDYPTMYMDFLLIDLIHQVQNMITRLTYL